MKHGCYAIDQLQTIITLLNVIQHVSALVQEGYGYGCITQLVFDPLNPQFVFSTPNNRQTSRLDVVSKYLLEDTPFPSNQPSPYQQVQNKVQRVLDQYWDVKVVADV